MIDPVAKLLIDCERNGDAPPYIVDERTYREARGPLFGRMLPEPTEPVPYDARGMEIFVVSDLHIASGRNAAGVFKGTENFFADDGFARFLDWAQEAKQTGRALLVINGDIFDFLRMTDYPGRVRKHRLSKRMRHAMKFAPLPKPAADERDLVEKQFEEWSAELAKVGIDKGWKELEASISRREKKYGLRTDDYKTIYKLRRIHAGHPAFLRALAGWLRQGNSLVVTKGNHDAELYWPAVRNYIRLILGEEIAAREDGSSLEKILAETVLPRVSFIDDAVAIDGALLVEHGHRYDTFSMILDAPYLRKKPTQINIPFGSFINRYLINRIELFYPFIDNVRPTGNVLPILMRENFPLALKVLFQHIPLTARMLLTNFRYMRFMFHRVFWFLAAIGLPLLFFVILAKPLSWPWLGEIAQWFDSIAQGGGIPAALVKQGEGVGMLLLSYLLARATAWFQLTEPSSLERFARERIRGTAYEIVTMGHTHNPGKYLFSGGKRFYNTGTWIPIIENSTADLREDRTYTFLRLGRDAEGKLEPAGGIGLLRWNDDAGRADELVLVERK